MIPPYPIYPDGVTYVPSFTAPNQILYVRAAEGQTSPPSQRDIYFFQRLNIPLGQTWAVFGQNPPSAHFVQMGMLPPNAPMYTTVLIGPQPHVGPPPFMGGANPFPAPPESDIFDPVAYEADRSGEGSVKDA